MKMYPIFAVLLAVVALVGLAGCNGPAPGLNPDVTFTYPEGSTLPIVESGATLQVDSTITSTSEENPITSYQWTTIPADTGLFVSDDGPETIWQAPVVTEDTPVSIVFTVETLLGGRTVRTINLTVVPAAP